MKPIIKEILRKGVESPSFAKEILPLLPKAALEENHMYVEICQVIQHFYKSNSSLATESTLLSLVEQKLDRQQADAEKQQKYYETVSALYEVRDMNDDSVIDESIEAYIKKHLRLDILKKSAIRLDDEEFQKKVIDDLRDVEALDVTGGQNEIFNVLYDEMEKRALLSSIQSNTISTGYRELDRLNGGGLAKGELGLVAALSGSGKTLFMTNLATMYVKKGYNVLYVALEEKKDRMTLRFEQSMLAQTRGDIIDGDNLDEEKFKKRQAIYNKLKGKLGNLLFSRYSPQTITLAKIEQLLSDAMLRLGIPVDVLIIDYPELLRNPNATGNESDDGGKLFEEVRRVAQDFNVVTWAASQLNRSAYNAIIRTSEHMEGSVRKKNACELVLIVNQYPEEYKAGFLRMYADKVRNPPEGVYDKMLGFVVDGTRQLIRDYKFDEGSGNQTSAEEKAHRALLAEIENDGMDFGKGRQKQPQSKVAMPNLSDEINKAVGGK
ncbi:DnaB family ATPase [Bacillus thuringiensis]|uniref:DnaB family ATPase n=1 Tax=Bacillus thuringiensis TaxID=1428 RepID=UPI000A38D751|nr:DnaB family ATPase [Bacillus thuringiensis]OTZ58480.1 hypothetical protein BK762_00470 [Bacillus thuringiensis serovar toumanoffi]